MPPGALSYFQKSPAWLCGSRQGLADHLDSVSLADWPGIAMPPLSRSVAASFIHAAALRAVPGEGKDRRGCTARVQPARHGSRSVLCGLGGIAAEVSVGGDGTMGSHGNQIRQA